MWRPSRRGLLEFYESIARIRCPHLCLMPYVTPSAIHEMLETRLMALLYTSGKLVHP